MYKDHKTVLTIGKAKAEMNYKVGLRQGKFIARVLFLFMIMLFVETLAIKWKYMGLNMMLLRIRTSSPRDSGSLKGKLL